MAMFQLSQSNFSDSTVRIHRRGRFKVYVSVILICICTLIVARSHVDASSENIWKCTLLITFPCLILKELFITILVILEELLFHFQARYFKSWTGLFECCCHRSYLLWFVPLYVAVIVVLQTLDFLGSQVIADIYHLFPVAVSIPVFFACCDILTGASNSTCNQVLQKMPSMAQIWANAAYTSYFKDVLESVVDRIAQYEEVNGVTVPLKKLILLIPHNCDVRKTFDAYNEDIKYAGDLEPIIKDQGANMNRCYKNPVYQILARNQSPLYVVMEQPSSLLTFWKLKTIIPPNIIEFQKNVFISTLQQLIEDDPCVLLFHDGKVLLSDFLRHEISRILTEESAVHKMMIE